MGSDLIVVFRVAADDASVFYFASEHTSSAAGEQLARSIAASIGANVEGRASAMLKETRAPSAVVSHADLDEKLGYSVSEGLSDFFTNAATNSR